MSRKWYMHIIRSFRVNMKLYISTPKPYPIPIVCVTSNEYQYIGMKKVKELYCYIHGTVFSSVGVCLLLFSGSSHSPLWQVAWLLSQLHLLTTLEGSSIKSRAQLSKGRKLFSRAWSVSCPAQSSWWSRGASFGTLGLIFFLAWKFCWCCSCMFAIEC